MKRFAPKQLRKQRGAVLVEYALVVAGVAIVALAALAMFGHKTSDLLATSAVILPGAHAEGNIPIRSGKLIETAPDGDGAMALDLTTIAATSNGSDRSVGNNIGDQDGADALELLVVGPFGD